MLANGACSQSADEWSQSLERRHCVMEGSGGRLRFGCRHVTSPGKPHGGGAAWRSHLRIDPHSEKHGRGYAIKGPQHAATGARRVLNGAGRARSSGCQPWEPQTGQSDSRAWRFRQACRRAPAPGDSPQQFARSKLRPRPATSPKIWGGCGSLFCQCDHGTRDRQVARAGDLVHCQERERRRAARERPERLRLSACGARRLPASAIRCQPSNRRTAPCQWPGPEHKHPSSRSRLLLTSALRISVLVAKLST